jgi:hypothetical protein
VHALEGHQIQMAKAVPEAPLKATISVRSGRFMQFENMADSERATAHEVLRCRIGSRHCCGWKTKTRRAGERLPDISLPLSAIPPGLVLRQDHSALFECLPCLAQRRSVLTDTADSCIIPIVRKIQNLS